MYKASGVTPPTYSPPNPGRGKSLQQPPRVFGSGRNTTTIGPARNPIVFQGGGGVGGRGGGGGGVSGRGGGAKGAAAYREDSFLFQRTAWGYTLDWVRNGAVFVFVWMVYVELGLFVLY